MASPGHAKSPGPFRHGWFIGILAVAVFAGMVWWISRPAEPGVESPRPGAAPLAVEMPAESGMPEPTAKPRPDSEPETKKAPRGIDASNFYKNAFVLFAALTAEERQTLRQPASQLAPEKAAALFEKIQPIVALLREAMEADYCEWGLGEAQFETIPKHLTEGRDLGRVATWSADYRFADEPEQAFADLEAQATFANNIQGGVIGWLLQAAMVYGQPMTMSFVPPK
jgi:hypothetical protein